VNGSRYRGSVLLSPRFRWPVFFLLLLGVSILARLVRSPWLAVAILVAVAILYVAALARMALRSQAAASPPQAPRNVTPIEPRVTAPRVVIVEGPTSPGDDLESKLRTLDRLRDDGLVTDEEYEAKRASLIADL
jgi:hypothetical protein